MEQELWLSRDNDGYYGFFKDTPYKDNWGDWDGDGATAEKISQEDFRSLFGCHPVRKGRKKRIKRILIELDD